MATKDKPAAIDFNLDTFERENPKEPFSFVLHGKRYVCKDPTDLDWQDAFKLDAGNARDIIKAVIGAENFDEFEQVPMPLWKLEALANRITTHYSAGIADAGEDNAS